MTEQSTLDTSLIKAYEAANYYVRTAQPFTIQISVKSDGLAAWYRKLGVTSAAFVTAYNPFGSVLSDKENKLRNKKLRSDMDALGLTSVNGFGQDKLGEWGQEDSFLIFGISLEDARAVGIKYEQNAIVWSGNDAIPQLILLR
jgi:hypothetical protein